MAPSLGDVVAVILLPGAAVVRVLGVLWDVGAVTAVLDPRWADGELHAALTTLRPRWVVMVDPEQMVGIDVDADVAGWGGRVITPGELEVGVSMSAEESGSEPDQGTLSADRDRPAAIVWTSGSSGMPRAVFLTVGNLDANAAATATRLDLRADDCWALTLSPAHVGGLALIWRARWIGCSIVADGPFDLDGFVDRLRGQEITHASLVPVMLRRLLRHPRLPEDTGLRALLIGGAHASPALLAEAQNQGIPVAPTYGMTETTSQVATATPAQSRRNPRSVGAPLDGVEIRVRDGEIEVRGATVASSPVDADGWFATGDLGHLDRDGHLVVTGRLSDRIITGGVTVSPMEVEVALLALPEVADAAVVGVPDPEWGERIAALLVPSAASGGPDPDEVERAKGSRAAGHGTPEQSMLDIDAIRDRLRGALSPAKLPREVRWVAVIPRNPNGKVDRKGVERVFRAP